MVSIVLELAFECAVAIMSSFLEHFHVLVDLSQVIQVMSINLLKSVKENSDLHNHLQFRRKFQIFELSPWLYLTNKETESQS